MPLGQAEAVSQESCDPPVGVDRAPQQQHKGAAGTRPVGGLPSQLVAGHSCFFVELFSGEGPLTAAVSATGVPCLAPQDLQFGGVDITDDDQFDALLTLWRQWSAQGLKPIFHMGTPCSSFFQSQGS